MHARVYLGVVVGLVLVCNVVAALEIKTSAMQLEVWDGEQLVTAYKYSHDQKYPYFWPVNGPGSGKSVTTESTNPYPHHHSLFFGCDHVNGGNYWQDSNKRGQILSQGPKVVQGNGDAVSFEDTCLWERPKKDPVIRDTRSVTVTLVSDSQYHIDFKISLEPLVDVRIEKTNHSLFSARMVPELSEEAGGRLINAAGGRAEDGTFGVASPWCDYSGERDGIREGLAIFQHPDNPWYPAKWFTRNYGFFSPTPMYWPEGDHTAIVKGETLTLQYRVVVHSGAMDAADIEALYAAYKEE